MIPNRKWSCPLIINMSNIEKSVGLSDTDNKQIESKRDTPPKNVTLRLWEKFKSLEKRTDEVHRHQKRYIETKNKTSKKSNSLKVNKESDIEDENGGKQDSIISTSKRSGSEEVEASTSSEVLRNGKKRGTEDEVQWEEVRELIDVNKHLDTGITYSQTELEKAIDKAVELGDIETAEKLSDKLANRQFGKKISDAFQAREYLKRKKTEEQSVKQKKSKKLHWGFQEKERWETKGNM